MRIPFTTAQFFEVIEKYNAAVFPLQIVIGILGILCLYLLYSKNKIRNTFIGSFLGFLWIWIGIAYHLLFFTGINKAAYLFGSLFILQGILFLLNTFSRNRLVFEFEWKPKDYIGYFFILYGLVIYPVISYFVEGSIDKTIVLGLPCPSTILTFGFLMLTTSKLPKYLLIIPSLWAIVGLGAALSLGIYQDLMMLVAAIAAFLILSRRKPRL